jgi:hypothetical protein
MCLSIDCNNETTPPKPSVVRRLPTIQSNEGPKLNIIRYAPTKNAIIARKDKGNKIIRMYKILINFI